jgi:lipoprotein-anchoring transpeptidase ErfK/SrfK
MNSTSHQFSDDTFASIINAPQGKWIEVALSQQRLNARSGKRVVARFTISSGLRATPTRRGTFRVYAKYRSTRYRGPGYNLPNVPWSLFYSGGYAIHGAYWHNKFGSPASHGCVNMRVNDARWVYAWAPVGTLVVIR